MKRMKRISFWNLWLVSIMGGILVGTIWANLLGGELLKQIGYFDGIFQTWKGLDRDARRQLWGYVVRQRLCEAGFGGLLAMTPVAAPGYLVLSFGTGMAIALVIAVFTLEKGWMGLGYWLGAVLPHGLCYGAVWLIFVAAIKERQDLRKIRIWLLTGILVMGGCVLEVWVNPWIVEMFF